MTTIAAILEANLKKKPHVGEKPQSKECKAKLPVRVSQTKISTTAIEPGEFITWTPNGYLVITDPEKDITRIYKAKMDKQGLVEEVKRLKEVKRRVTFVKDCEEKLLVDNDIYCLINGQLEYLLSLDVEGQVMSGCLIANKFLVYGSSLRGQVTVYYDLIEFKLSLMR